MIDLRACERNVFSQTGEDGVLEKIFEIVGVESRFAVEFGCGDGVYLSNTRNLILRGWGACLIEADAVKASSARDTYAARGDVSIIHARIQPETIQDLLRQGGTPACPDLMSIDLDSNDYYVREAIKDFRPRVLIMEYNASFPPPQRRVIKYHPDNYWDGSDYFGASLQSLICLNELQGYELIHCTFLGVNAIFVERSLRDQFPMGIASDHAQCLYQPPRYGTGGGRGPGGNGHPARDAVPLRLPDGLLLKKQWVELP